jgi:hypothetical protein
MRILIIGSILLFFFSCSKDNSTSKDADSLYADIEGNRLNFGPLGIQNFTDTCFYDVLLEAYVVQLTYNSIKEVVLGSVTFSNNFIISISLGATMPVEKEFSIVLPFSNAQFQYLEKDQSVVTFGGYIAKSGLLKMYKTSEGNYGANFSNIEFYSKPKDTDVKFKGSAQIVCN